jgi:UPF0755 protein
MTLMKKLRLFFWGLLVCLSVGVLAVGVLFLPNRVSLTDNQLVYIPANASARQVATVLDSAELVVSDRIFLIYARLLGKSRLLRAGYYDMAPSWSMYKVLSVLTSPTTHSRLIRVTLPEGYALRQMADVLSEKGVSPSENLLAYWNTMAISDYKFLYPYLEEIPTSSVEGYLFPDTYLFTPNSSPKDVTGVLLAAFDQKIFKVWESTVSRNVRLKNFHDYLTLASLVEKEAVFRDEMPRISGVFLNRLRLGMPLATDPTIVYALGDVWRSQVLYKDLTVDSPYNTYKNKGLPPTPIASPGVAAFAAVLAPESHTYLFFVALKNGGGRHVFTRSYREHLAAQGYR